MSLDPVLSARELAALPDVVLVDCRADTKAYRAGHLAGARHAQLERDLAAPAPDPALGGRHPLPSVPDFAATLSCRPNLLVPRAGMRGGGLGEDVGELEQRQLDRPARAGPSLGSRGRCRTGRTTRSRPPTPLNHATRPG